MGKRLPNLDEQQYVGLKAKAVPARLNVIPRRVRHCRLNCRLSTKKVSQVSQSINQSINNPKEISEHRSPAVGFGFGLVWFGACLLPVGHDSDVALPYWLKNRSHRILDHVREMLHQRCQDLQYRYLNPKERVGLICHTQLAHKKLKPAQDTHTHTDTTLTNKANMTTPICQYNNNGPTSIDRLRGRRGVRTRRGGRGPELWGSHLCEPHTSFQANEPENTKSEHSACAPKARIAEKQNEALRNKEHSQHNRGVWEYNVSTLKYCGGEYNAYFSQVQSNILGGI